jgi:hypothetical protein
MNLTVLDWFEMRVRPDGEVEILSPSFRVRPCEDL